MGADASWPLQRTVIAALKADEQILGLIGDSGRIHASPPAKAEKPSLAYGNSVTCSWHSATFDGQEHELTLELWAGDGAQARALSAAVIERLHGADLPVPGHALIELEFDCSETRLDADDETAHCRLRFTALTVSD